MNKRRKAWLANLALLFAILLPIPVAAQSARSMPVRWLVAGPFPGSGDNALFEDRLQATGGEARARARAGAVAAENSTGLLRWQIPDSAQDGTIEFTKLWPSENRAIAYAYAELKSDVDRYIIATVGSGSNIQVRLNGEVIYESRLSRKPEPDKDVLALQLRKGVNPLLVKVEGGPQNWTLQWKNHLPSGKLFVNERATIIPDFRIGERIGAWGQVEVVNAGATALSDVSVELIGDELVLSSRSAKMTLRPGEVRRIPFWVGGRKETSEGAASPLRLRVAAPREIAGFEFPPRIRKAIDYFVTTYRSAVDGSVQPYSVLLPTSFNREIVYPLIVLLHGNQVTDWGQNIISYAPKEWAIQVAVHDRGNNRYRDIGEVDLDEALVDVRRRYGIDSDRVYLSGHSMGGYGVWFQATRRPDRWASVSPQAGYTDYFIYRPAMREAGGDAQRQFQARLLEHWSPIIFAENLLHVPAYIVHGAKDDNVVVTHSRKMAARLKEFGYTHVYDENPEGGHWWGPRGAHYGMDVVDKPPISIFFQKHSRRVRAPKRLVYKTDSLRYREAYWVAIDELDTANQMAYIEAEVTAPESVAIRLSNITQFTLRLGGLVATGQPITARINERVVFHAILPPSARLTLRRSDDGRYIQLFDSDDTRVASHDAEDRLGYVAAELSETGDIARFVSRDSEPLRKTAELYGPVIDAFNTPFLFVVGAAGRDSRTNDVREAPRLAAEALAREWMTRANGSVLIKTDTDVTQDDIRSHNLILFGNTNTNSLVARINDDLPVRFTSTGIMAGARIVTGDDLGMVIAVPNPLNRRRYAVIVGGTTRHSFETAARLRLTDLPDYVIFDRRALAGKEVEFVSGGFFDKLWRLAEPSQKQTRSGTKQTLTSSYK